MPAAGTLAIIAAFVGLFLGGGALGGALAEAFAADSWIAAVAGFFALPLAFAVGLQAWYGLALLSLVPRMLERLRGRPARPEPIGQAAGQGIPGSFVFLPLGSAAGAAAGIVVGLASSTHPAWLVPSYTGSWVPATACWHGASPIGES